MGSGLKECLISRLLSKKGMKVLHIDKNNYNGGETSSRNIKNLWEKFRPNKNLPNKYDPAKIWNIDLVPKFIEKGGKFQ